VFLGAGGAAQSVAAVFLAKGAQKEQLTVIARRTRPWTAAAGRFIAADDAAFEALGRKAVAEATLLINATPLGLDPHETHLIPFDWLHNRLVVYDMIYAAETSLMKAGRERGARVVGGLGMLVHQGAKSFEIWFNRPAPADIMLRAAEAELKRRRVS
jgi:shikimate dehydrogenase